MSNVDATTQASCKQIIDRPTHRSISIPSRSHLRSLSHCIVMLQQQHHRHSIPPPPHHFYFDKSSAVLMSYVLFFGQLSLSPRNPLTFDISPLPPPSSFYFFNSNFNSELVYYYNVCLFSIIRWTMDDGRWTMDDGRTSGQLNLASVAIVHIECP